MYIKKMSTKKDFEKRNDNLKIVNCVVNYNN